MCVCTYVCVLLLCDWSAIPHLKYAPTLQAPRTTASEMTIMWPSWPGFVDPSISLHYQVDLFTELWSYVTLETADAAE